DHATRKYGEDEEDSDEENCGSDNNTSKDDEENVNINSSDGIPFLDKSTGIKIPMHPLERYYEDISTSAAPVVNDKYHMPDNPDYFGRTCSKSNSQDSQEVNNTINVGNLVGFNMNGNELEVTQILKLGDCIVKP
ncbi:hypothetical protein Tco_0049541, partial [Tanacetum coccineum]